MLEDPRMLELIRTHRKLFSIIFVLAAAGMIVTMFADPSGNGGMMGRGAGGSLAKVKGQEVSMREFADEYAREMQQAEEMITEQSKGNPEMRQFMEKLMKSQITPQRILESLVQKKFNSVVIKEAKIEAAPESVRDIIYSIPEFQTNGVFDPLLYKQRVQRPSAWEKELLERKKAENFYSAFAQGLAIESPLEKNLTEKMGRKLSLEALGVVPRQFAEPKTVSPDEVKSFLNDPASNVKLQAYYERHRARFEKEEEVRARHILVREAEGGEKKIKEILADIQGGKMTFEEAAKKFSSDKANAPKGGDLGYFSKNMMDASFGAAAFKLTKANEIAGPVKSAFGFHLIQFVDRHPALKKSLEETKPEIASEVLLEDRRTDRATTQLKDWATKTPPTDADLKRLGLAWTKLPDWSPKDERLGVLGNVDGYLGDIVALDDQHRYMTRPVTQGETYYLVRFVREVKANVLKPVAKKGTPPGAEPEAPVADTEDSRSLDKAQNALSFVLNNRYEEMKKTKEIKINEKRLAELSKEIQRQGGGAAAPETSEQ